MNTRHFWTLVLVASATLVLPTAAAEGEDPSTHGRAPDDAPRPMLDVSEEVGPPDPGSSCRPYC